MVRDLSSSVTQIFDQQIKKASCGLSGAYHSFLGENQAYILDPHKREQTLIGASISDGVAFGGANGVIQNSRISSADDRCFRLFYIGREIE
jgi:hypothetical protein